jgi:hypothetical protein
MIATSEDYCSTVGGFAQAKALADLVKKLADFTAVVLAYTW